MGMVNTISTAMAVTAVGLSSAQTIVNTNAYTNAYALNWVGVNPGVLGVCQGDCDNDASCPGTSVCVQRTNGMPVVVPGCSLGDSGSVARRDTDYCSNPGGGGVYTNPVVTNTIVNSNSYALNWVGENPGVLGVCQGDCDNDASCPGNSVCVQRTNGVPAAVPGCSTGDSGMVARRDNDYCSYPGGVTTDLTGRAASYGARAFILSCVFALGFLK